MSDNIIPVSTSQEIETKKVNINKLFTDFWFRVPEYQRSYKWGPEEIDDLLDDIQHAQRSAKDKEYFLGSVVLQKYLRSSGKLTYTCFDVLDGHLHQFEIKGERYGDPELLDDGFEGFECVDSTKTNLSQILPKTGKRFGFKYEYDFGDGWEHEVLFEGSPTVDSKAKYPLCLEGERACPPEDCGGVWGYGDFLEVIRNPKHEEHENMLEWIGGRFDSEDFDPKQATKEMKKGLPDWRSMR